MHVTYSFVPKAEVLVKANKKGAKARSQELPQEITQGTTKGQGTDTSPTTTITSPRVMLHFEALLCCGAGFKFLKATSPTAQ